ncbi:ActR/PrrA/RegA family redox response regulator transcription factor [Curvivirga aplysinae]|uniref:ActR/PrrA/RegA family redox response regulator transcription factor n=1 Tax=Curvivirga aplysinae TaxID=2529852 RepID=UPI0012BCEE1A|nr:ActR/PrrA/RegA family redox response regulator transcription factor [Curvivirga aplysinae]MTI10889.1 ActR/PrrA/RegA family redox response regulator transcription factor [Curvivirga aplysinae]
MSEAQDNPTSSLRERSLLLMDDDNVLLSRLARAMEKRGFDVSTAASISDCLTIIQQNPPAYAVMDLRLDDGSGLEAVEALSEARPDARIIMLTGYGNIATAVSAVKAGAVDYLSKPADADQITAALLEEDNSLPSPPENPMTADRARWEHIQRVYEQCDRNVSETARRLQMHRRSLQRILAKHAPKDASSE